MTKLHAVRAHYRKSPERKCAIDNRIHTELRREVDAMRVDAMGALLADALLIALAEDPDYRWPPKDMKREQAKRIEEAW